MQNMGEVIRETVIDVLRAHHVEVSPQSDSPDGMMILAKGDKLESRIIPKRASKKLLQYFARTYNVPIHLFYNPQMIPKPIRRVESA